MKQRLKCFWCDARCARPWWLTWARPLHGTLGHKSAPWQSDICTGSTGKYKQHSMWHLLCFWWSRKLHTCTLVPQCFKPTIFVVHHLFLTPNYSLSVCILSSLELCTRSRMQREQELGFNIGLHWPATWQSECSCSSGNGLSWAHQATDFECHLFSVLQFQNCVPSVFFFNLCSHEWEARYTTSTAKNTYLKQNTWPVCT